MVYGQVSSSIWMRRGVGVFPNSEFVYEIRPMAIGHFWNQGGPNDLSVATADYGRRNSNTLFKFRRAQHPYLKSGRPTAFSEHDEKGISPLSTTGSLDSNTRMGGDVANRILHRYVNCSIIWF